MTKSYGKLFRLENSWSVSLMLYSPVCLLIRHNSKFKVWKSMMGLLDWLNMKTLCIDWCFQHHICRALWNSLLAVFHAHRNTLRSPRNITSSHMIFQLVRIEILSNLKKQQQKIAKVIHMLMKCHWHNDVKCYQTQHQQGGYLQLWWPMIKTVWRVYWE